MDSMRSLNTSLPGASAGKQAAQNDSPEQLLDAFKNAALSVTKLYKASAAAQSKARMDGYQDCLDDLLAFLDKERIGLGNGDGRRIRSWATERLEGRENSQNAESDDEADKPETTSSPNLNHSNSETQLQEETQMRTDSTSPLPLNPPRKSRRSCRSRCRRRTPSPSNPHMPGLLSLRSKTRTSTLQTSTCLILLEHTTAQTQTPLPAHQGHATLQTSLALHQGRETTLAAALVRSVKSTLPKSST